jgi:hypothetical protein
VKIFLIALAVLAVWSLLVAICAPIAGRFLAKLDHDQNDRP